MFSHFGLFLGVSWENWQRANNLVRLTGWGGVEVRDRRLQNHSEQKCWISAHQSIGGSEAAFPAWSHLEVLAASTFWESETVSANRVVAIKPYQRYGPNTEIHIDPEATRISKPNTEIQPRLAGQCRCLSKRKAHTESQHGPHIVDTDAIAVTVCADAISGISILMIHCSGKKKAHKHIFFVRLVLGRPRVCPGDKPGLSLGQTQVFSLFYTVEARQTLVCPWRKPGPEGLRYRSVSNTVLLLMLAHGKGNKVQQRLPRDWVASCFSPYRAPEAPGAEISEKWEKITKFSSPVQPPKMGKNYRKITKNVFLEYFL